MTGVGFLNRISSQEPDCLDAKLIKFGQTRVFYRYLHCYLPKIRVANISLPAPVVPAQVTQAQVLVKRRK
jgi:hypothetical protein